MARGPPVSHTFFRSHFDFDICPDDLTGKSIPHIIEICLVISKQLVDRLPQLRFACRVFPVLLLLFLSLKFFLTAPLRFLRTPSFA